MGLVPADRDASPRVAECPRSGARLLALIGLAPTSERVALCPCLVTSAAPCRSAPSSSPRSPRRPPRPSRSPCFRSAMRRPGSATPAKTVKTASGRARRARRPPRRARQAVRPHRAAGREGAAPRPSRERPRQPGAGRRQCGCQGADDLRQRQAPERSAGRRRPGAERELRPGTRHRVGRADGAREPGGGDGRGRSQSRICTTDLPVRDGGGVPRLGRHPRPTRSSARRRPGRPSASPGRASR